MPNGSGYKSVESAFTSIDTIRQLREQIRSQRAELVEFEEKLRTERETHQRERQLRQHEFDKIKNSRGRALDSWDSTIISHEQQLARHRSESELKQQLSSSSLQLSSKSLENNLQQQQWSVAVEKSGKSLSTKHVFKSRDCVNDPDVASISYENLIESSGINAKSTALNQQQQVYSQKEQPPSPASSFGLETIDTRTDQTISSASKRRQRSGTMESRQHRVSIGYQYSIGSSEASSSQSSPLRTNFSVSTDLIPGTLGTLLSSMDPVSPGGGFRDGSRRSLRSGSQTLNTRKYVMQSAEFYGADFSNTHSVNLVLQKELVEVAAQHKITSDAAALDSVNHTCISDGAERRAVQGTVFLEALNRLAQTTSSSNSSPATQLHLGPNNSDGNLETLSNASQPTLKPIIPRIVQPEPDPVDYSDVFPLELLADEGLFVFRIENLKPVLMPESAFGKFCVADCYLILKCDYEGDSKQYQIRTWIGDEAEMDKRFCSAMFAVGLRNWINANCRIERECEKEESDEFLAVFDEYEFEYLDSSHATESGLFVAEAKRYPLRMYQTFGKKDFQVMLVDCSFKSLKSESVFLVDNGLEIYQWNGANSTLNHQIKCRMLTDRINKSDRGSNAIVTEFAEGEEVDDFKELLGFEGVNSEDNNNDDDSEKSGDHSWREVAEQMPKLYGASDDFDSKDLQSCVIQPSLKLQGTLSRAVKPSLSDIPSTPGSEKIIDAAATTAYWFSRENLKTDSCFIMDCGVELFFWIGKNSSISLRKTATEMLASIVPMIERPRWVGLHKMYEEHESEVFKLRFPDWNSYKDINWQDVKDGTEKALLSLNNDAKTSGIRVDVRALYSPPSIIDPNVAYIKETIRHANGLLQNFSIFVFSGGKFVLLPDEERGHFWNGDAYVFLCVYKMEQEQERQNRENDNNELLKKDTLVAKDEGSVTALKSSNDGEEVVDDDCDNEEEEGEEEMDNGSMECVVYFWQGRLAHRLAISTFKFKTQAEMERLMQDLYGCPVKVVYLDPGKEPIALLAHLNNTFILHSGSRKEFAQRMDSLILSDSQHQEEDEYIENQQLSSGQSRIATTAAATVAAIEKTLTYQIWTDLRYRTIRATQVQSQTSSLVSKNCFLCFTTDFNKVFIWVGKHTSREDAANAQACSHKILSIWGHPDLVGRSALIPEYTPRVSLHNRLSTGGISSEASSVRIIVIDEKAETRSFWSLFGLESSPPPARHPIPISSSSSSSKNVSSPSLQATLATTTTTAAPPESFTPSLARFLRCHCSEGYFLVEEIVHFNQCDLRRDSCIILDPGCWSPCYIWAGSESSDVVRKLTRKSVEVWFSNLADGRGLGAISAIAGEKSAPKPKFGPIRNNVYSEGDVVWISEGFETRLFCSLFQGWDSAIRAY